MATDARRSTNTNISWLKPDQVEALYQRIDESVNGFNLDNIPPGAEPYAAVWSLHPRYEVDENQGKILETEGPTTTQVIDETESEEESERTEPDVGVYSDALLLIDTLERRDLTALEEIDRLNHHGPTIPADY